MKLIDFQRTIKYFDIDKGAISVVHMADNVKRYELQYGGLKFSFVDDGKNNDVLVSGDIANFKYVGNDNIFGISPNNGGIIHIQTREGFLLALITASHNSNKKGVGNYEEINAKIIGEILAEVDPFVSYDYILRVASNGINFTDQALRDNLESFGKAVNPFAGMTADMVDTTQLPLNVGVNGGKDERGIWLDITDLNSKNSTRYTNGPGGFSYRLNYITPDKSERFELIHNYASKTNSEKIIIRKWLGKKTEKSVIKRGISKNNNDIFRTETKWTYSINNELEYDINANSIAVSKIEPESGKWEKKPLPYVLPEDLERIYGALNNATQMANEITSPLNPNHSRRR